MQTHPCKNLHQLTQKAFSTQYGTKCIPAENFLNIDDDS